MHAVGYVFLDYDGVSEIDYKDQAYKIVINGGSIFAFN